MLEARNVIPVDLARHPRARCWPEHHRHRLANQWIIRTLEHGQRYDLSDWPEPPPDPPEIDPVLRPVSVVVSAIPAREPSPSTQQSGDERPTLEELESVVRIWAQNRVLYPGWLVVPRSQLHSVLLSTDDWEGPMLRALPSWVFAKRMRVVHEIVWRRTILLDLPSPELRQACEEILEGADPADLFRRGIHDADATTPTPWIQWRTLACFLLTAARLRFDRTEFDRLLAVLEPFHRQDPLVGQVRQYEQALWAAYSLDHGTLASVLEDWCVDNADTVWTMRKATLFLEINEKDTAGRMLKTARNDLIARSDRGQHIANASREGWLLWALIGRAYRKGQPPASDTWRRWRELGRVRCDAGMERSAYVDALRPEMQKLKGAPFDLDRVELPGFSWSSREYDRWRDAHRAVRLCEVAALPLRSWNFAVGSQLMESAIGVLQQTDVELSARLCLRVADYDKDTTLTRVFARHRVASMEKCVVERLGEMCSQSLEFYARRDEESSERNLFAAERIRVAMEGLSRLVLRLDPEDVSRVLGDALKLYRNAEIASGFLQHEAMTHLLSRSWEALPGQGRERALFTLLQSPIVGLDGFAGGDNHPDACVGIGTDWTPSARNAENDQEWKAAADLIVRGLHTPGTARRRAANRAYLVNKWKRFTPAEVSEIADALWKPKGQVAAELPEATGLADWTFAFLPEPEPGLGESGFWTTWEKRRLSGGESSVEALEQVNSLIAQSQSVTGGYAVSEQRGARIADHIVAWTQDTKRSTRAFGHSQDQSLQLRAVRSVSNLLVEIRVAGETADLLYEKIVAMNKGNVSGLPLFAGILNAAPQYEEEASSMIQTCLTADSPQLAEGALWGIYQWTRGALLVPKRIPEIPEQLIREIGNIIAVRKRQVLRPALDIAGWVIDKAPLTQAQLVAPLAIQGLSFLAEELRYDSEDSNQEDVPALRRNCVRLAVGLADRGWDQEKAVRTWISESETDPLPEARFTRPRTRREESAGQSDARSGC